jgi:5-methylcytosine-specific restriction endonuclease McrA
MTDRVEYGRGWSKQRQRILNRDGWLCAWCGIDLRQTGVRASVDHVVSIVEGTRRGWTTRELNDDTNLVASCRSCNSSRSHRPGPPKRTRTGFLPRVDTTNGPDRGTLSPTVMGSPEASKGQRWSLGRRKTPDNG